MTVFRIGPSSFEDAIRAAQRRRVTLPEEFYGVLQGRARGDAFTVSRLAQLDQVQAVLDSLIEDLRNGGNFEAWRARVMATPGLGSLTPAHLETIYRTNLQAHYAEGRAASILQHQDTHPFLMYSAILDSRVRPGHARLHGIVLPVDHEFWRTHMPPLGMNCRCQVIALTRRQAERRIAEARDRGEVIDQPPPGVLADPGWDYDRLRGPASQGLERAAARRANRCTPRLYARNSDPADLIWCSGIGASVLASARVALRSGDPMPPPRASSPARLPDGMEVAEYEDAFMSRFGGNRRETVLHESVLAQMLAISATIFRKQSGESKITKRGRHATLPHLAAGILDPDEVWYVRDGAESLYYLARFGDGVAVQSVFRWSGKVWEPVTGYGADHDDYITKQRDWLSKVGVLIWRK